MYSLIESLRQHPEMAFFLVLALGHILGNLPLGSFRMGSVLGVLIAGIAVSQFDIPVSQELKNAFFMLFMFAIGYRTGPLFFRSLRDAGLSQILLALIVCVTAFVVSWAVARVAGFDAGTASGLIAGAMTGSAAFGAAGEAISRLNAPPGTRQLLHANAAGSFAVCYMVGTVLVIWLLTKLGPRIMRVDLKAACRDLEQQMGFLSKEACSSTAPFVMRVYKVPERFNQIPVVNLEDSFAGKRVFVERFRRNGEIISPSGNERLQANDCVVLAGTREALVAGSNPLLRHEVTDSELLDMRVVSRDVVVTHRTAGKTLGELASNPIARGIFLARLRRGGAEMPFTAKTGLERGDVLSLTGEESRVDRIVKTLGYPVRSADETDMASVSGAIFLGGLIGLPAIAFGGVELSLTLLVGVLLGGIGLGWLGSFYPRFGGVPAAALWLFDSLGLTGFLALSGMEAGPGFVRGLKESGPLLIASAAVVVLVPHVVGILAGRYLFRMHPGLVLGTCAGAGTSAPALGAVLQTAESRIPALSYSVSYALGNLVLALGGSLIVILIGP